MTTVEEDRTQARIDGLLQVLRDAEADFRWSYARVLDVIAEWDAEKAGPVTAPDPVLNAPRHRRAGRAGSGHRCPPVQPLRPVPDR